MDLYSENLRACGYFFASRFATILSISSIAQFICASSALYGAGVARSTPASLRSSYAYREPPAFRKPR
jgi:hypothetical protein